MYLEEVSCISLVSFYKVYHTPIYKSKETVNLMKYNSQLISVEHSIPHQKRLLKYSQLPAAQKPFYMDKKHATFNLSDAFYCHTFLSFNVLKSYKKQLQSRWSHVQTLRITQIHYLPQYNCIYMDE